LLYCQYNNEGMEEKDFELKYTIISYSI